MSTNHSLITSADIEEHAIVERWRAMEKNREETFKQPTHRFSSNHYSTLSQQIQDKFQQRENEEKVSNAYARDNAKHQSIIHLLQLHQERVRRDLNRELNEFRTICQQSTDSQIEPLAYNNDGNQLKCGPGSCLYFEGEDENKKDREKKQKEQMNQWIIEQCCQKYENMEEQKLLDQAFDHYQSMIAEHVKDLEMKQMMLRRQLNNDIKLFNQTLAKDKKHQQAYCTE